MTYRCIQQNSQLRKAVTLCSAVILAIALSTIGALAQASSAHDRSFELDAGEATSIVRVDQGGTPAFGAVNANNGFRAVFDQTGTTSIQPSQIDDADWELAFRLKSIGYESPVRFAAPEKTSASDSRVTYRWNSDVKEWWVNSAQKLEQWFELKTAPPGRDEGAPLRVVLGIEGDFLPVASESGIQFLDPETHRRLTYDGLYVWDANGAPMPAHMTTEGDALALVIDDRDAEYPLTIDPSLTQEAYLKATNTEDDDAFGYSVAISGNTAVVGAPNEPWGQVL